MFLWYFHALGNHLLFLEGGSYARAKRESWKDTQDKALISDSARDQRGLSRLWKPLLVFLSSFCPCVLLFLGDLIRKLIYICMALLLSLHYFKALYSVSNGG